MKIQLGYCKECLLLHTICVFTRKNNLFLFDFSDQHDLANTCRFTIKHELRSAQISRLFLKEKKKPSISGMCCCAAPYYIYINTLFGCSHSWHDLFSLCLVKFSKNKSRKLKKIHKATETKTEWKWRMRRKKHAHTHMRIINIYNNNNLGTKINEIKYIKRVRARKQNI